MRRPPIPVGERLFALLPLLNALVLLIPVMMLGLRLVDAAVVEVATPPQRSWSEAEARAEERAPKPEQGERRLRPAPETTEAERSFPPPRSGYGL